VVGKAIYLAPNLLGKAKVIRAEICFAIVCYYAFESRQKPEEAKYSFAKFGFMGLEGWIQGVTGWQPELPASAPTFDDVEKFINDRLPTGTLAAAIHPGKILQMLQECNFSASGYQLYLYLEIMHLQGKEPSITTICQDLNISRATFKKWLKQVQTWSHCADWIILTPRKTGKELIIQQRLHQELGGIMEAKTPIGPVDLLTKTEIIEIKKIADWKEALGQVIAKALGFPKHQKRIHLFGSSSTILKKVTIHCQPLDVLVTFEKITESPAA
jgi:AraC-like DNA-binding protein